MKEYIGIVFSLGRRVINSSSTKQKINSRSSTEAEIIGIDNKISKIIQTKKFLEAQRFLVKLNIIYQDNTSTIKLCENRKASSNKRTRYFDIRLFYITDLISRDEVVINYCPSGKIIVDYLLKPLVGSRFRVSRKHLVNL